MTDPQTLAFLGDQIGKKTRSEYIKKSLFSRGEGRTQTTDRELITQQQLKEFLEPNKGQIIVYRSEGRPLRLAHAPYFTELPVWSYLPDAKYREPSLRRLGRRLFARTMSSNGESPSYGVASRAAVPATAVPLSWPQPPVPTDIGSRAEPRATPRADSIPQERIRTTDTATTQDEYLPDASPEHVGDEDLSFLRLLEECFHDSRGSYLTRSVRRSVWQFSEMIDEGSDFKTQHAEFESWLASPMSGLRRDQAERVAEYMDIAIGRALHGGPTE